MREIGDNPHKQAVTTYVAKHLHAMMTDPNFHEQLLTIAHQLEADPHLHEQLSAMMDLEKEVLEKMDATENEPSALVEVAESSVQANSKSGFNPLHNVLGRL